MAQLYLKTGRRFSSQETCELPGQMTRRQVFSAPIVALAAGREGQMRKCGSPTNSCRLAPRAHKSSLLAIIQLDRARHLASRATVDWSARASPT